MFEIFMPNLGMTMLEGKVIEWKVENNSQVEAEQEVCEVASESGKLTMIMTAPGAGKLTYKVELDEQVKCGTLIAAID